MKEREDSWVWKDDENLGYLVKFVYEISRNETCGEYRVVYKSFWDINVLPSMQLVAWRVLIDRLLTRTNLESRGMVLESKCGAK